MQRIASLGVEIAGRAGKRASGFPGGQVGSQRVPSANFALRALALKSGLGH